MTSAKRPGQCAPEWPGRPIRQTIRQGVQNDSAARAVGLRIHRKAFLDAGSMRGLRLLIVLRPRGWWPLLLPRGRGRTAGAS